MTIKEINELRKANEKINTEEQKIYKKELERLNEEEIKTKKDLKKKIKSHFKGVEIDIGLSKSVLRVSITNKNEKSVELLYHVYGEFRFYNITKKLAHTILNEYEEVYGEIEKQTNDYVTYEISPSGGITGVLDGWDNCYSTETYTK